MLTAEEVSRCRSEFPALDRRQAGQPVVYLDGPAGTQVPRTVADAIGGYLLRHNANHGGLFLTSRESDAVLEEAHRAMADFLGAEDAAEISFGPNMTSITFALSRALARTWRAGDNIVVTRLDHDANVTPWILAAADAGVEVRHVGICRDDCTLDLHDLRRQLSPRTRLLAIGCASNATGTVNPVRQIGSWAHDVGALVFLDAVHYAPHRLPDVRQWDCDFLGCSAYKFFGPHVGVLWGRRHLLEKLPAYKVRPAPDSLPGKWMTGTQNHEGIAGVLAAVDYLAALGRRRARAAELPRRAALAAAFAAISAYERELTWQLLDGLAAIPPLRVWGITRPERWQERVSTVSVTHTHRSPRCLAEHLADRGIFTWHGNYYALPLTEALGLEPDGMLRIGLVHYNTPQEVDRLLACLRDIP